MSMLSTVFGLIFRVAFMIAVGYIMRKKGVLGTIDQRSMTAVLMKIVVFFTIIMSSQNELSTEAVQAIVVTAVMSVLMYLIGIPLSMLVAKKLRLGVKRERVFVSSCTFCNVTYLGYPIAQELFGNEGLLCAIMYSMVFNLFFYTWGISYLSGEGKMNGKAIFTNKIAIASLLTLALYFLQVPIPEPLAGTFSAIGGMTMPLSMLITGCALADSRLIDIVRDRKIYIATFIRMVACPALVYGGLRLWGFQGLVPAVCTILAGLPTGTMTGIVAAEYDCEPDYAAKIMIQTMIAMAITLPLWMGIVQR